MPCRVSQEHDDQSYNFRGDGYSEINRTSTSPYNKYFFSVSFNFRSFDENALLFLAVSDDRRGYVSISLHQGKVRYRVGYTGQGDGHLEITTAVKYNTGNWTRVEASRYAPLCFHTVPKSFPRSAGFPYFFSP